MVKLVETVELTETTGLAEWQSELWKRFPSATTYRYHYEDGPEESSEYHVATVTERDAMAMGIDVDQVERCQGEREGEILVGFYDNEGASVGVPDLAGEFGEKNL